MIKQIPVCDFCKKVIDEQETKRITIEAHTPKEHYLNQFDFHWDCAMKTSIDKFYNLMMEKE